MYKHTNAMLSMYGCLNNYKRYLGRVYFVTDLVGDLVDGGYHGFFGSHWADKV